MENDTLDLSSVAARERAEVVPLGFSGQLPKRQSYSALAEPSQAVGGLIWPRALAILLVLNLVGWLPVVGVAWLLLR